MGYMIENLKSHTINNSGNAYSVNFYTTSDASKKTNITSISNLLPLKSFNWKETGKKSYGFIAQELKAMGLTELIDGEDGNMTVNYNAALSYFLGCLSRKVEELENEIKELKSKLK